MLKDLYKINYKKKNSKLVDVIKSGLSDLKNETKNMGEKKKETEKPNEIIDVVEEIIEFNKQKQEEKGLNILTPDQMLSRLPIIFAQVKAGNNSQNLKTKLDNYCILCTDQKNLQNNAIIIWSMLFKNGNNLYEHWK